MRVYDWVLEFSIIIESYAKKAKVYDQKAWSESALEDRGINTSSEIKFWIRIVDWIRYHIWMTYVYHTEQSKGVSTARKEAISGFGRTIGES